MTCTPTARCTITCVAPTTRLVRVRLFWGTDLTKLPCSYRQAVTMFTEELSWLNTEDKDLIMGRALCEWHGWGPPIGPLPQVPRDALA